MLVVKAPVKYMLILSFQRLLSIYTLHSSPAAAERFQLVVANSMFRAVSHSVRCGHSFRVDEERQRKSSLLVVDQPAEQSWGCWSQSLPAVMGDPRSPDMEQLDQRSSRMLLKSSISAEISIKNCPGRRKCLSFPTWEHGKPAKLIS